MNKEVSQTLSRNPFRTRYIVEASEKSYESLLSSIKSFVKSTNILDEQYPENQEVKIYRPPPLELRIKRQYIPPIA